MEYLDLEVVTVENVYFSLAAGAVLGSILFFLAKAAFESIELSIWAVVVLATVASYIAYFYFGETPWLAKSIWVIGGAFTIIAAWDAYHRPKGKKEG